MRRHWVQSFRFTIGELCVSVALFAISFGVYLPTLRSRGDDALARMVNSYARKSFAFFLVETQGYYWCCIVPLVRYMNRTVKRSHARVKETKKK